MSATPQRVFIVGTGVIAGSHANYLKDGIGSCYELHAADPNPEALKKFAEDYPGCITYADSKEMLAQPVEELDVVLVATPPFLHEPLVKLALDSGRHTLCEKPLGIKGTDAKEMLALAREKKLHLGCCSARFLFPELVNKVREILDTKMLGEVYSVAWFNRSNRGRSGIEYQPQTDFFIQKDKNGGGNVSDWGTYDFTLLQGMFQAEMITIENAVAVQAETALPEHKAKILDVESHGKARINYHRADGQVIPVDYERASCTHGSPGTRFEIEGTKGALTLDWYGHSGDGTVSLVLGKDEDGKLVHKDLWRIKQDWGPIHQRPLDQFLKLVRGEEAPMTLVDEQAVFSYLTIPSFYKAAETGQTVTLKLSDI